MNLVIITGNLGADPELAYTNTDKPVVNLRVATKNGYDPEKPEWVKVTVWGPQAESCAKYLRKGNKVAVTGFLNTRTWEKEGVTHYSTEVVANNVEFLTPPTKADDAPQPKPRDSSKKAPESRARR